MNGEFAVLRVSDGTVVNVIVGEIEIAGFETVPLPSGVWIGHVRQPDGSFVDPNTAPQEEIVDEVAE